MDFNKNTILLVDDESTNLKILSNLLKEKYDLRVVKNGQQAIDLVAKGKLPDLILLDIVMPDIDGYSICEYFKTKENTKDIPIIFISSMNNFENEEKGLRLGAVDYITKPFVPSIVLSRVNTHLKLSNSIKEIKKLYAESICMNKKLEEANSKLNELSLLDELIGIPNRRSFNRTIKFEYKKAILEEKPISLILIDIDFFKRFNDNYGHVKGDDVLCFVGQEIQISLRQSDDFVARYGGEEFVVILPNTDLEDAEKIAERIRQNVENLKINHEFSEVSPYLTISCGLMCNIPEKIDTLDEFINQTDKLLYIAKSKGKNRIEKGEFRLT